MQAIIPARRRMKIAGDIKCLDPLRIPVRERCAKTGGLQRFEIGD